MKCFEHKATYLSWTCCYLQTSYVDREGYMYLNEWTKYFCIDAKWGREAGGKARALATWESWDDVAVYFPVSHNQLNCPILLDITFYAPESISLRSPETRMLFFLPLKAWIYNLWGSVLCDNEARASGVQSGCRLCDQLQDTFRWWKLTWRTYGKAKLTSRRPNESNSPIQKADPLSGRRGVADGSTKWQRQLPSGLRESSGRESVRRCGISLQVCLKRVSHYSWR